MEAAKILNCSYMDIIEKVPLHVTLLALAKQSAENEYKEEQRRKNQKQPSARQPKRVPKRR